MTAFEQRSLSAQEVGDLLGCSARYVLERLAHRQGFPVRCTPPGTRPRWIAGEVIEWRERVQLARVKAKRMAA